MKSINRLTDVITHFREIQSMRAQAYTRLKNGITSIIHDASNQSPEQSILNEASFRQLSASLTHEFQTLSHSVIELERELREQPLLREDVANTLRRIQELEKQKFQSTVSFYALKVSLACNRFSWQQHEDTAIHRHACNGHHDAPSMHNSGIADDGHCANTEPTEQDVREALCELVRSIEESVNAINECIEEIEEHLTE